MQENNLCFFLFFKPFYTGSESASGTDGRTHFGCHDDESRWEGKSKHLMFTCVQMRELDAYW